MGATSIFRAQRPAFSITYTAAAGEHVVIKGSEQVTGWQQLDGNVWRVTVSNDLFGSFNLSLRRSPATGSLPDPTLPKKHLGEVYLNGTSTKSRRAPTWRIRRCVRRRSMSGQDLPDRVRNPEQTRLVWYAEVGTDSRSSGRTSRVRIPTTNLSRSTSGDPFYPEENYIDYITVRGFELAQAATPWAPPTADQPGLVGPNWAKGWIIEDNVIHDAKCSAISIGKDYSTGHNYATAISTSWRRCFRLAGSAGTRGARRFHLIRRNAIFDCGQNAIVGHLGCVFSTIEDNYIYNIAVKREFYGYEIAGIKLHAALDAVRHNRINDCTLGTWLDWQTQGTRVAQHLLREQP